MKGSGHSSRLGRHGNNSDDNDDDDYDEVVDNDATNTPNTY